MQKKNNTLITVLILVITLYWSNSYAQDERQNIGNVVTLHFQTGGAISAGDLSKRYGNFLTLGTGMDFITEKSNWIFGWKGDFHFGTRVKENVLGVIGGADGFLFGNGLASADDFSLKQRGFYLGAHVGKIIPLSSENSRSGIRLTLGAGLLQHRIRLQQDPVNFVPQIDDEYGKGYDRLTNGLALRQFIGYQLLGKSKLVNFLIGIEAIQGFTQNRRSYNFDEMRQDTTKRLDIVLGLKIGWMLPFYVGESTGQIYY